MTKKIFGAIFFALALLALIGAVGNLFSADSIGSPAAKAGSFIGTLFTVALYAFSGIFLFTFDSVYKLNAVAGFKLRSRLQRPILIISLCVYGILSLFSSFSAGIIIGSADNLAVGLISGIVVICPYMLPVFLFIIMVLMYSTPHAKSKKYFIKNEEQLNYYLSDVSVYAPVTADNFVMASRKALYFPKQFCVIPFDQIESVKLVKQLWEQDVFFYLTNGKKFYIMTKHFNAINEAVEAHKKNSF